MVGTPEKIVHRYRAMASSTASGSNRGMSTSVPPNRTAVFRTLDRPNTWNIGSTATLMSSSRNSNSSPPTVQFMYSSKWVSSAPLGLPVVPLV